MQDHIYTVILLHLDANFDGTHPMEIGTDLMGVDGDGVEGIPEGVGDRPDGDG